MSVATTIHVTPYNGRALDGHSKRELPHGWRIRQVGCADWDLLTWNATDREDLRFSRRIDCELACKAINESNLSVDDFFGLTDEQFGELICRYLQW